MDSKNFTIITSSMSILYNGFFSTKIPKKDIHVGRGNLQGVYKHLKSHFYGPKPLVE